MEQRLSREKQHVHDLYCNLLPGTDTCVSSTKREMVTRHSRAIEADLITESEHRTKMAVLYQSYFRNDRTRIEEIIIRKIEG